MSSGFRPTRASLLLILAASMLTLMGGAAVAPALPLISEAFPRASDTDISLIITLPSLAIALTGFAIGHLADKYGKVKVLILSLAIFTVAGSSGYYLGTVQSILAGRFVLGMGIAGMSAASTALVAAYYTGVSRTRVISYQSAAIGLGVLVLETSGGGLATFGWREPFLIYLIGAVILVGVVLTLKEPAREDRAEAQEKEGGAGAVGKVIALSYLTVFLMMFMGFLLPTKLPYYLSEMGASALVSGLMLGWHGICNAGTCFMYRRIASRCGRSAILTFSFLLMGIGFGMLYFTGSYLVVFVSVALVGAGMGMIMPAMINWLATTATSRNSGKIMGGFYVANNIGQFSCSILAAPILLYVVSYSNLFLAIGLLAFAACALCLFATMVSRKNADDPVGGSCHL